MAEKPHTKFKDLNSSEKVEYIIDYYKLHIIVGIVTVLIIGWFVNHYFLNPPAPTMLDISFFTMRDDVEYKFELEDGLNEVIFEEGEHATVFVDHFNQGSSDYNIQMANVAKLTAKVEDKDMDILFFTQNTYDIFLEYDDLLVLNDIVAEFDFGDATMITRAELGIPGNGDDILLIDATNIPSVDTMVLSQDTVYLALYKPSQRIEYAKRALPYLLSEDFDFVIFDED